MLEHVSRVAEPKLVPENCVRYLQTILTMGEGYWSQNVSEVLLARFPREAKLILSYYQEIGV